jgi:hypothetical protein
VAAQDLRSLADDRAVVHPGAGPDESLDPVAGAPKDAPAARAPLGLSSEAACREAAAAMGHHEKAEGHSGHRPELRYQVCSLDHFRDRIAAPLLTVQLASGCKREPVGQADRFQAADLAGEYDMLQEHALQSS